MGIDIVRLYETVRYLTVRQIAYQVYYRGTKRLAQRGQVRKDQDARLNTELDVTSPIALGLRNIDLESKSYYSPSTFVFLNQKYTFQSTGQIDWNHGEFGKLWTYNLNYFEFLRETSISDDDGVALIADWINNEHSHIDGWEPYPTSLRLVNWIQFFRSRGIEPDQGVMRSIKRQYESLWTKIEYHIDGNHLLENALSLVCVSRYLGTPKQQDDATDLLLEEVTKQYLPSGLHYERSFMYQLILIYRQLDVLSNYPPSTSWTNQLRSSVATQIRYIDRMIGASSQLPDFNDSTAGIAPEYRTIVRYADLLGIVPKQSPPATGVPKYVHWSGVDYDFWFDAAQIGPQHIPGHAHADNLTFALNIKGQPTIVDTGISTYEKNERRKSERSTSSHNTVVIAGSNSSDVWGGFRVGSRATTRVVYESDSKIIAQHDGYLSEGVTCVREVSNKVHGIEIVDSLVCKKGVVNGTAYLHFDHTIVPMLKADKVSASNCTITFHGHSDVYIEKYNQAIGFNKLVSSNRIVIHFDKKVTTTISWS